MFLARFSFFCFPLCGGWGQAPFLVKAVPRGTVSAGSLCNSLVLVASGVARPNPRNANGKMDLKMITTHTR